MNLQEVYVPEAGAGALPRPVSRLVCSDHELICRGYEAALSRGLEASYGRQENGTAYCLEVLDCSLGEFCEILLLATSQRNLMFTAPQGPGERDQPETAKGVS